MTSLHLLKLTTLNEGLSPQSWPHLPYILFQGGSHFILVVELFK